MSPDIHVVITLKDKNQVDRVRAELIELGQSYTEFGTTIVMYPCAYNNTVQKEGHIVARSFVTSLCKNLGASVIPVETDSLNLLKECLAKVKYTEYPELYDKITKHVESMS